MNCSQVVFLDAEASVITHSAIMRGGFQKKTQFVFFLVTPVSGRMYVRQAFFISEKQSFLALANFFCNIKSSMWSWQWKMPLKSKTNIFMQFLINPWCVSSSHRPPIFWGGYGTISATSCTVGAEKGKKFFHNLFNPHDIYLNSLSCSSWVWLVFPK